MDRYKSGLLKGVMFIHLKQDLDVMPLGWIGCEEPPETPAREDELLTSYGIRKEVQGLLAGIRTDLDSFSDAEAFTLMTSGYRMAEHFLPKVQVLPRRVSRDVNWDFLAVEAVLRDAHTTDPSYHRLVRLLRSGGSRMFRVWSQSRAFLLTMAALGIGTLAALIASFLDAGGPSRISVTIDGWSILAAVALSIALAFPRFREHAARITVGVLGLASARPRSLTY